jgi:YesN/AraC family two-component response regulator
VLAVNVEFVPRVKLMGFVSYQNPWIHFKRNTDEYILYIIKSGELHIQENGVPHVLKKGDIFMLEPNLDHEGTQKQKCDYYYIHFVHPNIKHRSVDDIRTIAERSILEGALYDSQEDSSFCFFPKRFTLTDKTTLHQVLHNMNEILKLYRRKYYNRSLTALKFSELLVEISREYLESELQKDRGSNTKSYMKVHELLDYIHQNYTKKITSAEIEQNFECNYDYINRIFNKITGYTITRYVNMVRIQHAKELIEATHLSIGEIGYLTGLEDPYYFSKVFKKYTGRSPIQYYKKMKDDG